jgi:hypothetical protein
MKTGTRNPLRTAAVLLSLLAALLTGCGGGSSAETGSTDASVPSAVITAPAAVTGAQAGYAASVPAQAGCTYAWTITNGTIVLGAGTECIAFTPDNVAGSVTVSCTVTGAGGFATRSVRIPITPASTPPFNITQCLTDRAQGTTIAFAGFGMMTGNLGAQSFFPPGKVADYWGFQFLRDNDPDDMGHNTSFLTRVSCNVLFVLDNAQIAKLKALAATQSSSSSPTCNNLYAWKRWPLMKAFRRLMDGEKPAGTTGLSLDNVKAASRDLYLLDGRISYQRAVVYADIFRSLTAAQKAYLGAMVGKGYDSWPDKSEDDVRSVTQGLSHDEVVAMMTYAGDIYSWYAGSVTSDVYFCPERHGTYFGSFYIKDAPAVGHPGYGIDETMTAEIGSALIDDSLGYISAAGAAKMNQLVEAQRANLYGNPAANIVLARTRISEALRSLITSTAPPQAFLDNVLATVDAWSAIYGELDGENNYRYATTFAELWTGTTYISDAQKTALRGLRTNAMTVTYEGTSTPVDFSTCTQYFLYAADVSPSSADFLLWTGNPRTDPLFQ